MPELPEVEVTRRKLMPLLVGRRIARVKCTANSYFFLTPPKTLARRLQGRTAVELERLGKYLIARLDDDSRLLLHLGMTGQLFGDQVDSVQLLRSTAGAAIQVFPGPSFVPDSHTHMTLKLEGPGGNVYFRDPRKFGKVQWLAKHQPSDRLQRLGTDALVATGDTLFGVAQHRKIPIKSLLLDQSVLAGVGNIYADEALFRVRISPQRAAHAVTRKQCHALVAAVQAVMLRSIETGGSSISDYVQPDGQRGQFQDERAVYGLAGEPCGNCKTTLHRITIGGRSSHYCPRCQRS